MGKENKIALLGSINYCPFTIGSWTVASMITKEESLLLVADDIEPVKNFVVNAFQLKLKVWCISFFSFAE